jgi:hypothetical protein
MIFGHLCNYGAANFSFILQNGQLLHFDYMLLYIQYTFDLYKYVTKKLELQNSIWFFLLKLNNDPLHFKKTYLTHFKTNLSNFCALNVLSVKTTKYF